MSGEWRDAGGGWAEVQRGRGRDDNDKSNDDTQNDRVGKLLTRRPGEEARRRLRSTKRLIGHLAGTDGRLDLRQAGRQQCQRGGRR